MTYETIHKQKLPLWDIHSYICHSGYTPDGLDAPQDSPASCIPGCMRRRKYTYPDPLDNEKRKQD